ncbi:secernin-3 [Candidatus Thorarchaeota archaeon]|nr:MAG: secernin-3 [Candidatus Thorarchaeota archaeon]
MCDTIVALGNSTKLNHTIFAKNSDRPPNEAQVVKYIPRQEFESGTDLHCTYIEIPQVQEVNALFLSKPFWIWGAEMGANEHGVAIGNEAVYSKDPVPESGLLGMDLLRLGLERGKTAIEALDTMTELLERHGQGGTCERDGVLTYHNSFLIADPSAAWVLETSGQRWVAQKIENVRAISNGYTIHKSWDRGSHDIKDYAAEQGWWDEDSDFDFAQAYENEAMRYIARCDDRLSCSKEYLQKHKGQLDFSLIANHMRSHPDSWTPWTQESAAICQHASHVNSFRTTGSQISVLDENPIHWFTGSSNPCMSIYFPFSFSVPSVYRGMDIGREKYNPESFWWRRESTRRKLSKRFSNTQREISALIDRMQNSVLQVASRDVDRDAVIRLSRVVEDALEEILEGSAEEIKSDPEFIDYWQKRNSEADLPESAGD